MHYCNALSLYTPPPLGCHTFPLQSLICIELSIRRSARLQGLEPQPSDTPDSPKLEDTALSPSASVEFAALGVHLNTPACVQSDPLSDIEEQEEEEMLQVPPPPEFGRKAGKDNLQRFAHDLDAWYYSAKSTSNLNEDCLFELIALRALPYASQTLEWFKRERANIERAAREQVSEGSASQLPAQDALLSALMLAFRMEFEFLSVDREQELYAMELRSGEDVVGFALKIQTVAKDGDVKDKRAARRLAKAVSRAASELAQEMETDLMHNKACLA